MERTRIFDFLAWGFSGYISQQIGQVITVGCDVDNPSNVILFKFNFAIQGNESFDARRETKQFGWEDIHKHKDLTDFIVEESKPIIDWLSTVDKGKDRHWLLK